MKKPTYIAIAESSDIVFEGLSSIFYNSEYEYFISRVATFDDVECLIDNKKTDLLLINPTLIYNNEKVLRRVRRSHPDLLIGCVCMALLDKDTASLYDFLLNIYDSATNILTEIKKHANQKQVTDNSNDENASLTDRETEVLLKIIKGNTNKEIADILCISVHTVISHRKNIMTKTGIRSQSGLALYAVSKSLISLDDFNL